MRTLYDSVNVDAIPPAATFVAGYIDGRYADLAALAARFPAATRLAYTVNPADDEGDFLDVETGDARPADAPGWVARRRAAGARIAGVYCSTDSWGAVKTAFWTAKVPEPPYALAQYDGVAEIPQAWLDAGVVIKQYQSNTAANLDTSVAVDYIPGIDPAPTSEENDVDATMTPTGAGTWRLHADGTIFTAGDAQYYGGYPDLPPAEREGTRSFVSIERLGPAMTDGYVIIADDGAAYRFNAAVWANLKAA